MLLTIPIENPHPCYCSDVGAEGLDTELFGARSPWPRCAERALDLFAWGVGCRQARALEPHVAIEATVRIVLLVERPRAFALPARGLAPGLHDSEMVRHDAFGPSDNIRHEGFAPSE